MRQPDGTYATITGPDDNRVGQRFSVGMHNGHVVTGHYMVARYEERPDGRGGAMLRYEVSVPVVRRPVLHADGTPVRRPDGCVVADLWVRA